MIKRYLTDNIAQDLKEKIILIAGPRQVGKTTLAHYIGKNLFSPFAYFNWDYQPDRKKIINFELPSSAKLLVFDEFHKYKGWKKYIKGIFDKHKDRFKILVTGSARLDVYRKGGESLFGRYYFYLLHPFSLSELINLKPEIKLFEELEFSPKKEGEEALSLLFKFGGFPEPLLKANERFWKRWQAQGVDRLVKEEIRELVQISDLSNLQVLVEIIPSKVGSLLSVNNLREDLEVAHKTLTSYLEILQNFYYIFQISPFASSKIKSLRKRKKVYLWDWSRLEDESAKFENLIASHLLKFADFIKHALGEKAELFYLRDLEEREVDFLVVVNGKPWFAVEAKLKPGKTKSLEYFGKKLNIPYLYQVVMEKDKDFIYKNVRTISADKFLTALV